MVLTGQHGWSVCQTVTLDGEVVEISDAWVLALSPMAPISVGANIRNERFAWPGGRRRRHGSALPVTVFRASAWEAFVTRR